MVIYVLTLEIGPLTRRYAEATTTVESAAGDVLLLGGLMDLEWEDSWSLGAVVSAEDLALELLPGALDVPGLLAEGHDLASAAGELARLREGQPWEAREVLHRGRLSDPTYGDTDEPVAFSLRRISSGAEVVDPPDSAVIRPASTLGAGILTDVVGRAIPFVFGQPGVGWDDADGGPAGSPALRITAASESPTRAAIAYHPVEADKVFLYGGTDANGDRQWGERAVTSGTPSTIEPVIPGTSFWIRWSSEEEQRAALRGPTGGPITSAGELLERQLLLAGQCDRGRTAAAVPLLTTLVDGYYDEQLEPRAWAIENVLPLLPASLVLGPDGWFPRVWRAWLPSTEVEADLDAGRRDVSRLGVVSYDGTDRLRNEIRVEHTLDAIEGAYTAVSIHSGNESLEGAVSSEAARLSYQRFGTRVFSLNTDIIYREASALQVASWMIARHSLPTRRVSYQLDRRYRWIEPGTAVKIADPSIGIDHVCSVEQVVESAGDLAIMVRVREV